MSSTTKTQVDQLEAATSVKVGGTAVPTNARTITAGAGLTGGGDLSSDRTIDVAANADGSIVVNANDLQVGVISDAQHGSRGGGLHAPKSITYTPGTATPSVSGGGLLTYMSISNSSPTTITNFTGGTTGQVLVLVFNDANTTIDRTASVLLGGANFTSAQFKTLTLVLGPGALWHELARSANG